MYDRQKDRGARKLKSPYCVFYYYTESRRVAVVREIRLPRICRAFCRRACARRDRVSMVNRDARSHCDALDRSGGGPIGLSFPIRGAYFSKWARCHRSTGSFSSRFFPRSQKDVSPPRRNAPAPCITVSLNFPQRG